MHLTSFLDYIDGDKDAACYSLCEHTTCKICYKRLVLEKLVLQYATLKQLIASKVKCGCRDRTRNMDGKSSVKTSNALLTHRILHDLANYLAASYFLAACCIGILDL